LAAPLCLLVARPALAEPPKQSADDGWPDLSKFLDEKYGFLPIAMPITEPAVGYGVAAGAAFLSGSLGQASRGLGRPNITFVGALGTENGSWGIVAADVRYWLRDRIQTQIAGIYASVNLDYHGIGRDSVLADNPLRYNLTPAGVMTMARYRFGETRFWGGLGYTFASTEVTFEAPEETPRIPDYESRTNMGRLKAVATFDTRDNMFTPVRGVFVEGSFELAAEALGGDDTFEALGLQVLQFVPLPGNFYFGLRGEGSTTFGDAPFYVRPFVMLRGVPMMRYQGDTVATLEGELRWQFWRRFSLVGFVGAGEAWNGFFDADRVQAVVSGGGGFRYELARKYGIHMGADVAFSPDTTAFYIQVGSAWMRP
jgi:outer membrane protein assembly factor BamA